MKFNWHSGFEGRHAFLSASKHHWINYDDEKLERSYSTALAAMKGSQFHDLAANLIKMGVRLPRSNKTINAYVNDAIGFRMTPEQVLFYSENAFGTADAISFKNNLLRIHDLKTGVTHTSFNQLLVYAAFFCLEYNIKPAQIAFELRIYQNDEIKVMNDDSIFDEVTRIMSKMISFDRRINEMKAEVFA